MAEQIIEQISFDKFSVTVYVGDSATLLLAENYVTIREVFVDNVKVEPNDEKQIFLSSGGDTLWELAEGDIVVPVGNRKYTSKTMNEVDVANGSTDKFLNEQGDFTTINTSPIGVTGSELYMSVQNSDVAGYKLLSNTIDTNETEITLTANSSQGIVWGNKYLTHEYTATTIPTKSWGFDYWRKVSTAINNSSKHLRVFIYRGGIETNIITLISPDINDTDFVERQVAYTLGAIELQQGDRIGVQYGFSTTRVQDVTLTLIIGDGRGWFMRVPLAISHEDLQNKNAEASFQHIDTTISKQTLVEADKVPIYDSVAGKVVLTGKSNVGSRYDAETVSAPANGGTLTLKNATETVISTILTNSNSFTIALPTAIAGKVNESILIFKTGATLPTLTQPAGVVYRTETPVIAINQTWTFCYERVSFDGGSTFETYVSATKNV